MSLPPVDHSYNPTPQIEPVQDEQIDSEASRKTENIFRRGRTHLHNAKINLRERFHQHQENKELLSEKSEAISGQNPLQISDSSDDDVEFEELSPTAVQKWIRQGNRNLKMDSNSLASLQAAIETVDSASQSSSSNSSPAAASSSSSPVPEEEIKADLKEVDDLLMLGEEEIAKLGGDCGETISEVIRELTHLGEGIVINKKAIRDLRNSIIELKEIISDPNSSDKYVKGAIEQISRLQYEIDSMETANKAANGRCSQLLRNLRNDTSKDIFRQPMAIKGFHGEEYLLSQPPKAIEEYQAIVGPQEEQPVYNFQDVVREARRIDPTFGTTVNADGSIKDRTISCEEASSQGALVSPSVDRFLDSQGVTTVEKCRIYSRFHQGLIAYALQVPHDSEDLDRAANPNLKIEERYAALREAFAKTGTAKVLEPAIAGVLANRDDLFEPELGEYYQMITDTKDEELETHAIYTKLCTLDIENHCIEGDYLVAYPNPQNPEEKKVYHYHARYDYTNNETAYTLTEGSALFPKPQDLNQMNRFPVAQFAE